MKLDVCKSELKHDLFTYWGEAVDRKKRFQFSVFHNLFREYLCDCEECQRLDLKSLTIKLGKRNIENENIKTGIFQGECM